MLLNSLKAKAMALSAIMFCTLGTLHAQQGGPPARNSLRPQTRAISSRYVPRFMKPVAAHQEQTQEPVVDQSVVAPEEISPGIANVLPQASSASPGCVGCGEGHIIGGPVDQVITGCDCGSCGDCGGGCFGGCPEDCRDCGFDKNCWINGFGGILRNSEYFVGVQAFKARGLDIVGLNLNEPAGFGYNVGFNSGLPLYAITCGLVSGQIGIRYAQSNYERGFFSPDRRNQLFFTGGLYRRVDYGIQFGVVADVLREEWIVTHEMVQIRTELSYVWPAGHAFGFRSANGVQNERSRGRLGIGVEPDITTDVIDNYRFFYRHACAWGGYSELFAGWSDQTGLIGADYELPLGECTALQTGFTYVDSTDELDLIDSEAWNIFLNVSFRPRGRGWYQFYHRPLFPVADNGSMLIRRD